MPEKFSSIMHTGRLTERERARNKLHLADGRRLVKHPAFVEVEWLLTTGQRWFEDEFKHQEAGIPGCWISLLAGIMNMQEIVALLREGNEELSTASREVQKIYNQLKVTSEATIRDIEKYTNDVRTARMNATVEIKHMLTELTALRSFFHGQDYTAEMSSVERFIHAAQELKSLRDSGVLDLLLDGALKLKEKGETK